MQPFGDDHYHVSGNAEAEFMDEARTVLKNKKGIARTIKLVTDVLALQTDRPPLRYDESDVGRQHYIRAAIAAFDKGYAPMEHLIRDALNRAKDPPPRTRASADERFR